MIRSLWLLVIVGTAGAVVLFINKYAETTHFFTSVTFSTESTQDDVSRRIASLPNGLQGYETTLFGTILSAEYNYHDTIPTRTAGFPEA
jgi:hypothetical protein